ncbi:MAG TPA: alkyl hydroperoxide reductase subunit F [Pseudomonadales bacterium]|nr:alkyl hydroperoxide reductase subunit F [Pseudomonadales bacterium]
MSNAPLLDDNLKTQLRGYLERLVSPIELITHTDDSDASRDLLGLVQDVAAQSDRITVRAETSTEQTASVRRPSFSIAQTGEAARVHFAGLPLGHEFTSLVLALLQVSGYAPKIEQEKMDQIRALTGPLHFETYVSLSCHNCPDVVQAFNTMSALNPAITHTMIDGALFQQEVTARDIMGVPTTTLNGEIFGSGRMTLEEILAKVDKSTEASAAQKIAEKAPFDVLVVGGGPAGAAAAIYAARKGIRTGVVAERFGGQVLDTMAIENFISVQETDGPKLAAGLEQHVKSYDVDIMNLQRAEALQTVDGMIEIKLASGVTVKSKSVILATGARWREMHVPGENTYRGRGVAYCPHCDGPLFKGKRVAVIGGGNSGIEAAIDLAGVVSHVTVLEFDAQLRADAVLQKKLASLPNVTVITSALTTEVTGDGNRMNGITYTDRISNASHHIALEGVFVQIGLLPNTEWLKGTVALSKRGEIEIDARGATSVPGVFAAGDATTVPFKQIIIAMGAGATAALGAFDHMMRQ